LIFLAERSLRHAGLQLSGSRSIHGAEIERLRNPSSNILRIEV
jgi:hypothetical protein